MYLKDKALEDSCNTSSLVVHKNNLIKIDQQRFNSSGYWVIYMNFNIPNEGDQNYIMPQFLVWYQLVDPKDLVLKNVKMS